MKVIIAGSRSIVDFDTVCKAVEASGFEITEVVSGKANGVDALGENWAEANDIPVKGFPANWKNVRAKGAVIRSNKYGKYNAVAGILRNQRMAKYADALIAVWDGVSTGTSNMIKEMEKLGKPVFVYEVK